MGFPRVFATISLLALLAGSTTAADLSKIPRTITKEPAYKTKPKYCLVVFGPEASKRMWLVLDGDVMYVDKNCNGDLTEKGGCMSYRKATPNDPAPPPQVQEYRRFSVGDLTVGDVEYSGIEVGHSILKKTFETETEDGKEMARLLKKDPGLTPLAVQTSRNGKTRIWADGYAADSPQEAPILHIDGPLTMKPLYASGLVRREKGFEFFAVVGTKGLGEDAFAIRDYQDIPKSAKPLLEVEFPSKDEAKGSVIKVWLDRC